METILNFNQVVKAYGDNVILNNINLKIFKGEFVSVIGPSGCGKSTLLKLAMGQEKETSGQITLFNKKIDGITSDIGIVYQKYSLFPHLTIKDNLNLGLNKRSDTEQFEEDYQEMIKLFRIDHLVNLHPHNLSGGQQQRAAIVQSLLAQPKILFMDEAFGALDIYTKQELKVFLDEYWKKHDTTIIFITHDLNDAINIGSRVILLSQYYKDANGARILYDRKTKLELTAEEETELIQEIKTIGFDPFNLQEIE